MPNTNDTIIHAPDPNGTAPAPRQEDRITRLIDDGVGLNIFNALRELGMIASAARDNGDLPLERAAHCEANVLTIFEDANSLSRFGPNLQHYLNQTDIPYLRERAAATADARARARYAHAIVKITNRHDDGNTAVDAAIESLSTARSSSETSAKRAENFHTLVDVYPLAFRLARRFRAIDRLLEEAIVFLNEAGSPFVHAQTRLFSLIINEVRFTDDQARRMRDASIRLIYDARGEHGDVVTVATSGRRLADRLGEPHALWLEAEAKALEARLEYKQHPMLVQIVCTRLLRIYQLLGDEPRATVTIARARAASADMEYTVVSIDLEGAEESEAMYRAHAREVYAKYGPFGALAWLATNALFPGLKDVEHSIDDLEARGIGTFRKIATTLVSADERLIAQDPPNYAFDEQYNIAWRLAVQTNAMCLEEFLDAGLTLNHIDEFLRASWLGANERSMAAPPIVANDLVDLLRPSLRLFLDVLDGDNELRIPALDSLVLRFEAVLRKLARLSGVPHVRATDRGKRPLIEHAGLELLDREHMIEVAGADLVAFAKHTLLRAPEGLRDRVGHAILHSGDYGLLDLYAMVLLLLRFAAVAIPAAEPTQAPIDMQSARTMDAPDGG